MPELKKSLTFPSCIMESVPPECDPHGLSGGFNEGRHLGHMELVDDEHFAEEWAQSRAHKHGRRRIEQELTHKGVDREVARRAVGNLTDEDQLQDAIRLVGKFLSRTHGDMDRSLYQRTLAMLARHGYDADIARKALMSIARGADAEE